MTHFTLRESDVEEQAMDWFGGLGYEVLHGGELRPDTPGSERKRWEDVVLIERLSNALARLNPGVPPEAREEAVRRLLRADGPSLVENNRRFHQWLVDGVDVEIRRPDGSIAGVPLRLVDFEDPEQNDWLAVNQLTVVENKNVRRPDVVLFVNGLPLAVIELKDPTDAEATIWTALKQLETYKNEIPSLFVFNEALVISDGSEARIGTLTTDKERFMPWRTVEGDEAAPETMLQL